MAQVAGTVRQQLNQLLGRHVRDFDLNARYREDYNFVYLVVMKNLRWDNRSPEFRRIQNTVADLGGSLESYGWNGGNVLARFTISKAKLGLK